MQEDRPKENINTTDKSFLSLIKQELDIILVALVVIVKFYLSMRNP